MVQEQRLQLKMTFLLGYNTKNCCFVRWWEFRGSTFLGGEGLSKALANDGILVKKIFAIKDSERNKLLGVYFHSSQPNWEICGNDFYVP